MSDHDLVIKPAAPSGVEIVEDLQDSLDKIKEAISGQSTLNAHVLGEFMNNLGRLQVYISFAIRDS